MKRAVAVASLTMAMASAPALAFAANASSADGLGNQSVTRWYGAGANVNGSLTSRNGAPVYFNGTVVYDSAIDNNVGRYVSNTSSRISVTRGGRIGSTSNPPNPNNRADGVKFKVCRDRANLPDPCGNNSSTMRR